MMLANSVHILVVINFSSATVATIKFSVLRTKYGSRQKLGMHHKQVLLYETYMYNSDVDVVFGQKARIFCFSKTFLCFQQYCTLKR